MRRRAAAVAFVAGVTLVHAQPAPAVAPHANVMLVNGAGTISPGLQALPLPQAIGFTGTAVVVGTDGILASYACAWDATGLNDNVASGFGTASGACGPIAFATCVWTREGTDVQIACVDAANGSALHGRFVFKPGDTFPTTTFTLDGMAVVV